MMVRFLFVIACAVNFSSPSSALDRVDVRVLIRAEYIDTLERVFSEDAAEFDVGDLRPSEFETPYLEFATTHPAVDQTTQLWLTAYPASPHAMTARGLFLHHTGVLLRGDELGSTTPRTAFAAMNSRLSEAGELFREALAITPKHIVAAEGLVNAAMFLGNEEWRRIGLLGYGTHADPLRAFKLRLQFALPQWGGGIEAINSVCDTWLERLADAGYPVTQDQCVAYAYYMYGQWSDEVAALLDDLPPGFDPRIEINSLKRAGKMQEALALAEQYGLSSREDVLDQSQLENDYSIYEDWLDRHLEFSPLNPEYLQWRAYQYRSAENYEKAWPQMEKAVIYGRFDPRLWQDLIRWAPPDKRRQVAEDAIETTDGHPAVLALLVQQSGFTDAAEHVGMDAAEFECWRYDVAVSHKSACKRAPRHQWCQTAWSIPRDTILGETKSRGICGADKKTWQDRVRTLLKLDQD